MRTSLRLTRSCVFSISPERFSTLALISPTSLPTYFLVAHPEAATPAIRNTGMIRLIGPPFIVVRRCTEGVRDAPGESGLRHVAAARLDGNAPAPGRHLDPPEPGWSGRWVVTQPVLVLQLAHDRVRRLLEAGEITDHESGAPRHLGVAREHDVAHLGHRALLARVALG